MSITEGVLLGLVHGITEFLPVSALGHVILVQNVLTTEEATRLAFDGLLHLATALAVVTYFWSDIWILLQAGLRKLGRLPVNQKDLIQLQAFLLGTIPVMVLGLIIEPYGTDSSFSAGLIASVLLIAAVFLMYVEWRYYTRAGHDSLTIKHGFLIGLFQVLALLPGFSRTAATMGGGMLLGLSRSEAVRFSFLLAVPLLLSVGIRRLLELISIGGSVNWTVSLIGSGVAFIVALLVIHAFISYVRQYTLWPFIWYGVVLAALVGYVAFVA